MNLSQVETIKTLMSMRSVMLIWDELALRERRTPSDPKASQVTAAGLFLTMINGCLPKRFKWSEEQQLMELHRVSAIPLRRIRKMIRAETKKLGLRTQPDLQLPSMDLAQKGLRLALTMTEKGRSGEWDPIALSSREIAELVFAEAKREGLTSGDLP